METCIFCNQPCGAVIVVGGRSWRGGYKSYYACKKCMHERKQCERCGASGAMECTSKETGDITLCDKCFWYEVRRGMVAQRQGKEWIVLAVLGLLCLILSAIVLAFLIL